jgi:hypothetical protein
MSRYKVQRRPAEELITVTRKPGDMSLFIRTTGQWRREKMTAVTAVSFEGNANIPGLTVTYAAFSNWNYAPCPEEWIHLHFKIPGKRVRVFQTSPLLLCGSSLDVDA